jgi:hypothetical protein
MASFDEGKAAGLAGEPRTPPYPRDSMDASFWEAGWDGGDRDRRAAARRPTVPNVVTIGEVSRLAVERVRRIAKGATINGTYKLAPEPALDAFRADLLRIVGE